MRALAAEANRRRGFSSRRRLRPRLARRETAGARAEGDARFRRAVGLSLLHSLFAGGVLPAPRSSPAPRVVSARSIYTHPRDRRFIGAIMQPGGMTPGAIGHETTLRVAAAALLHSRLGRADGGLRRLTWRAHRPDDAGDDARPFSLSQPAFLLAARACVSATRTSPGIITFGATSGMCSASTTRFSRRLRRSAICGARSSRTRRS